MPAFVNHSRTYTWPPSMSLLDLSVLSAQSKQKPEIPLPNIDDDPFAHFISPVTEEDDPYSMLSFSAGILPGDAPTSYSKTNRFKASVAKKWARYVARNHEQLHSQYHGDTTRGGVPRIVEPEDEGQHQDEFGRPYKVEVREPTRGRAQDLLSPERRRRGRRISRTHSGHRHSWREPSPELFTVCEEEEAPTTTNTTTTTDDGASRRPQRKQAGGSLKAKL